MQTAPIRRRRHGLVTLGAALLAAGTLLLTPRPVHAEPASAIDHYQQGLLLLSRQEYQTALDEFRTAVVDQPTNSEAYCGLGMALYKLNNLQEASLAFDRALAVSRSVQTQAQARSGLGDIYLQLGEHALAASQYRRALSHYPRWNGARLNLVRCLLALHQWDAAASELDRLQHDLPSLAEGFQLRSELALIRGDLTGAHRAGLQAWTLNTTQDETHLAMSCALACQLGDYPAAVALLQRYQGPRTDTYWRAAGDVWSHWLARIGPLTALGQDVPLAWRADPRWLQAEAVAAYERSLLYRMDQQAVRQTLAWLDPLAGYPGDGTQRLPNADAVLVQARMNLARQARAQGQVETGWRYLLEAVRLDPLEPGIYALAGQWRLAEGNVTGALRAWEWGLRLNPADAQMQTGLRQLYGRLAQGR